MSFAVVDLETTGLQPDRHRIIDVGIVLLDSQGRYEGEWQSLVNPGIPVTATFVHGISDDDVRDAPFFSDILPELVSLIQGRAIVAHNAPFDTGFLNAAFARAHYPASIPDEATVCTMELSKIYLPHGRHGLVHTAERAGITISNHHRALPDARTAAELLRYYLAQEESGQPHFMPVATTRSGKVVKPASWVEAQLAAQMIPWIEGLSF